MTAKKLGFTKNELGDYASLQFPGFRIIPQCGECRSGGKASVSQYYLESPRGLKMRRHFSTLKDVFLALSVVPV